jgi:nucleoside-diphosphate-sugar epimerase
VTQGSETEPSRNSQPAPSAGSDPGLDAVWLVTGGAGWLGTNLLNHLVATGRRVRALALPSEALAVRARFGSTVDVVEGDVRDQAAVGQWAAGTEAATVVHLAGVIHPGKVADFQTINVDGTRNVLEAALAARAGRVVVMSSNSPIGTNPTREHRFDEASPYHPYLGYGRSKQAMEELVGDFHARFGLATTLVRAPWFYGPYQPPRQTLFFEMVRDGKAPIVGDGGNMRSMSYVDNLVQGIELCATHAAAPGRTFWIADARPYSMNEIVDTVEAMLEEAGIPCAHTRMRLPAFAGPVAYGVDAVLQRLGLYQQKIHVLGEMDKNIACSIEGARTTLGYDPQIDLAEGMRRSIRWAIDVGQLRVPR